jgi:ketosteroid isomerase-like protein
LNLETYEFLENTKIESKGVFMKVFFPTYFFLILITASFAQNQKPPCSENQAKQFDFWLGTWDLEWQDAQGKIQKGVNKINKIMNGCVIEENFSAGSYLGKSHSMFDRKSGKWKQTWVDNGGEYLDLVGEFKDRKMILNREFINPLGKKVMQKMTFFDIKTDSFEWLWERSDDEGKTWKTNWKLTYKRKQNLAKKFDIKEVKALIDDANKTYDSRFKKNDDAYWNATYTANACTMPPNMKRICGRENIRKFFVGNGEGIKLVINAEDVSGSEDLVVETGNYLVNDLMGTVLEKGKFIATWKQEDGKWKMHSEIWSSDETPPKQ